LFDSFWHAITIHIGLYLQVLLKKSIYATLAIYAVVAAAASIASLLLPVETKGKQLQESPTAVS